MYGTKLQRGKWALKNWFQKNYKITNPIWKIFLWRLTSGGHKIDFGNSSKGMKVFDHIHDTNFWGSNESISGPGSELLYTQNLREELPRIFKKYQINSMLDAPCGDCNWIKEVEFPDGFCYKGGDIVRELLENSVVFKSKDLSIEFLKIDITSDKLPVVDAWLCRDVLFHLSNSKVIETLKNLDNSDISWLLTTHFDDVKINADIKSGGYRPVNLTREPFNLPPPKFLIEDFIIPYPPRHIAVWHKSEIEKHLKHLS